MFISRHLRKEWFFSTSAKITGPWSKPVAVIAKPGLEDPCPFWDDDGNAYLIHGRVGASPLILHHMAPGWAFGLDDGRELVKNAKKLPTLEGPKLYKRHGYYYVLPRLADPYWCAGCTSFEVHLCVFTNIESCLRKGTRRSTDLIRGDMLRRKADKAGSFTSSNAVRTEEWCTRSSPMG